MMKCLPQVCKQEAADETDGELQIDESAGQSPMESVECDTNSTGRYCFLGNVCKRDIFKGMKFLFIYLFF